MHIPDGMLDAKTFTTLWVGATGSVSYASRWIRRHLDSNHMILMAVMASLIFALQMLNFPIAAGTSGHFAGAAIAAIVLGFWPASIVMSGVLIIQAFIFGDGGITTLGANIINMGVTAPCVATLIYHFINHLHDSTPIRFLAAFLAAFGSVVASAAMVAIELWASARVAFYPAMVAMVSWHALIGIGEGVVTVGIVAYLAKVRPQLLDIDKDQSGDKPLSASSGKDSLRSVVIVFAVLAVAAAGLSFLASSQPDGLEFVYFETGIGEAFSEMGLSGFSPITDYLLPGVTNEKLSVIGAGIIGVILTGALLYTISTLLLRKRSE